MSILLLLSLLASKVMLVLPTSAIDSLMKRDKLVYPASHPHRPATSIDHHCLLPPLRHFYCPSLPDFSLLAQEMHFTDSGNAPDAYPQSSIQSERVMQQD